METVEQRLNYLTRMAAVLRTLEITNRTMTYAGFARAIGLLKPDSPWGAKHRTTLSRLLYALGAVERFGGQSKPPLDFGRVVDQFGRPGQGLARRARIVMDK